MGRVFAQSGIFRSLVLVVFISLQALAFGLEMDTSLLVQQSPTDGGIVTPEIGIHQIVFNSEVKIRAIPEPGYQFVYWLGDVVDPGSSSTIVIVDGPKIIIAVFERVAHEFITIEAGPQGSAGGQNRRIPNRQGLGNTQTSRAIARKRPHKPNAFLISDPFLVPGMADSEEMSDPDNIEEIPEPATVLLVTFGTLFMSRAGKRKNKLRKI